MDFFTGGEADLKEGDSAGGPAGLRNLYIDSLNLH